MMDHDLLMIIYGGLIGIGSSIIATLFQSWLDRREYERRQKEDKKSAQARIYIPTQEVSRFTKHKRGDDWEIGEVYGEGTTSSIEIPQVIVLAIIMLVLVLCITFYLSRFTTQPIIYMIDTAIIVFILCFLLIRFWKQKR